jgi:LCP family protein required for cell wall assembly
MGLWGRDPGRKRHILRWISVAVVIILGVAVLGSYFKTKAVYDSIKRVPLTDLGKRPPQYSTSSMNLLIYGSDSRAGLDPHEQYLLHTGYDQSDNTDTIMLVHISPGRHLITVVSIPRDTMVPMYQCASGPGYPGQQADPGQDVIINSLLAIGGPSCLFKTVEQQTGIYINHFIGLGMLGFVNVINDIGGANVCLPFAVNDPVSGLQLPAGEVHVTGVQALAFWRTREDIGTGSDLERIQRDQFMSAQLVKAVLGSGMLSDPFKLLKVVTDAAAQMTTDSGMSASDLFSLAQSFRGLNSKDVQFITAPNEPDPADPDRVQFAQPQASQVFSAIAHDVTVPKTAPVPAASPAVSPAVAQELTTTPSDVSVEVLNGSGQPGAASSAGSALTTLGFDVTGTGDAAAFDYTSSVIEYASAADLAAVNTLKQVLTGVTAVQDASLTPGTIELIVGSGFTAPAASATTPAAQPSPSPSALASSQAVASLAQSDSGITAAASCASDANAFAGPLSP